jgi:hypothetical protein
MKPVAHAVSQQSRAIRIKNYDFPQPSLMPRRPTVGIAIILHANHQKWHGKYSVDNKVG